MLNYLLFSLTFLGKKDHRTHSILPSVPKIRKLFTKEIYLQALKMIYKASYQSSLLASENTVFLFMFFENARQLGKRK